MRRFLYILILSAITVVLITFVDLFFTEEERNEPEGNTPAALSRIDLPSPDTVEPSVWNVSYPLFETMTDSEGKEVRVQTASFNIEHLQPGKENRYNAKGIQFIFYNKSTEEKTVEEREIMRGSADRGILFSRNPEGGSGLDLEFLPEFILKDNVVIFRLDPQTGEPSFSFKGNDLVIEEKSFHSTGPVEIFREGLSITGEELAGDLDSSSFTLSRNIHIEGNNLDFSNLFSLEPAGNEEQGEASRISLSASGPLHLTLAKTLENDLEDRFEGEKKGSRLELHGDVEVIRDDLSCRCELLTLDFRSSGAGKTEVESLIGRSENSRTVILAQGYTVRCSSFRFEQVEDRSLFVLDGKPEIDNVTLPLFSTLSDSEEEASLLVRCGDQLVVESPEPIAGVAPQHRVSMSGGVSFLYQDEPDRPILRSDRLSFEVERGEKESPRPPSSSDDPETAQPFLINNFVATEKVSGRFKGFDLTCHVFTYDYTDTSEGQISRLQLDDPAESALSSEAFSLYSPRINIEVHADLTDIIALETFRCATKIENLPPLHGFDLVSGDSEEETAPAGPTPGNIEMTGRGTFRLLVREEGAHPIRTVDIKEGQGFKIEMFRETARVLTIEGERTFTLVTTGSDLTSLELGEGGHLESQELGFSARGDARLRLRSLGEDNIEFLTEGADAPAFVSFQQPDEPEPLEIEATSIWIFTGVDTRLEALDSVRARVPLSRFSGTEKDPVVPTQGGGYYTIGSNSLEIEGAGGASEFILRARGKASIQRIEMGLDATCENLTYESSRKVLSLAGTSEQDTEIRIASPHDPAIQDLVISQKVDINLTDSTIHISRGGNLVLNPYDRAKQKHSRIAIRCQNEIVLRDSLLEFRGPLNLDYQDTPAEKVSRNLSCKKLSIYFVENPLLAKLSPIDFNTYKNRVKEGQDPLGDENSIRRLKAEYQVNLSFDRHTVDCSLLNWNLLEDELLCDGRGEDVVIALGGQMIMKGNRLILRPVLEELTVINSR